MIYTQEQHNDCTIIRFQEKRIDVLVAQELKTELLKLFDTGEKRLGLDLSNVTFVDSSGLGALVAVLKKARPEGALCLWGLTPEVKSLFELTQLYKVFDIYELEQDALSRC
ncbi:MAG: STAS domain-containing protein [Deltaproteobacteria bacterium]|nr:STAS domain-containing protein [Deltaproteobacteria bacterium]